MLWAMGRVVAERPAPGTLGISAWGSIGAGLLFCWMTPNLYQVMVRYRPALVLREQISMLRRPGRQYVWRFHPVEAAALSAIVLVSLFSMRGTVSQFLYFMF
jgi:hypothetical protein